MSINKSITDKVLGIRSPGTVSKRRVRNIIWPFTLRQIEVEAIENLSRMPDVKALSKAHRQTLVITDRATAAVNFSRSVFSVYKRPDQVYLVLGDRGLMQVDLKHGARSPIVTFVERVHQAEALDAGEDHPLLKLNDQAQIRVASGLSIEEALIVLRDAASSRQFMSSSASVPNVSVRDSAKNIVSTGHGISSPKVIGQDKSINGVSTSTGTSRPRVTSSDKASEIASTGAGLNPPRVSIQDKATETVVTGAGVYTAVAPVGATALEDFETAGLNGGGSDFGWSGTGVTMVYAGTLAVETFESASLSGTGANGDSGWAGNGVTH